jgi:hypothetical protein
MEPVVLDVRPYHARRLTVGSEYMLGGAANARWTAQRRGHILERAQPTVPARHRKKLRHTTPITQSFSTCSSSAKGITLFGMSGFFQRAGADMNGPDGEKWDTLGIALLAEALYLRKCKQHLPESGFSSVCRICWPLPRDYDRVEYLKG